ncbi:sulfotransferase domain-containing protein [Pseudalkalibacillus hwajinpoensis]|nr:sulfotransferase domain-containing protein [Pseudalkalibacillus hwajinpoensis]
MLHSNDQLPAFLMTSMPKSGTHLMKQLLLGIPGVSHDLKDRFYPEKTIILMEKLKKINSNHFGQGHLFYSKELSNSLSDASIKHIFISRDLRDVVVSFAYFIESKYPAHPLHSYFTDPTTTQKDKYLALIEGLEKDGLSYPNIASWASSYEGWLSDENTLTVTFEDLMSSTESMERQLIRIVTYLWEEAISSSYHSELIQLMKTNLDPSASPTFRNGHIGNWKEEFDHEVKSAFNQVAGDWLIRNGYEKNQDWL